MSIYKKLFEAKKEIGKISKDSKNPFFKSNYLSLNGLIDAVDEVLQNNGLIMLQPIEDGKVKTQIFDIDEGRTSIIQSEMTLPNIQDPQKLGSAITYYRRYTLQSLLGLQAEDDDGNLAAKKHRVVTPTEKLNKCKTLVELATVYKSLSRTEQEFTLNLKDKLKTTLK